MGESRLKNPDRYIERLKTESARNKKFYENRLKEETQRADDLLAEMGEHVFHYDAGGTRLEDSVSASLGKQLRIGGHVVIKGHISKLEIEGDRVHFRMGLVSFYQVED